MCIYVHIYIHTFQPLWKYFAKAAHGRASGRGEEATQQAAVIGPAGVGAAPRAEVQSNVVVSINQP